MGMTLVVNEETFLISKNELDKAGYNALPVYFHFHKSIKPIKGYLAIRKKSGGFGIGKGNYPARVHQHREQIKRYSGKENFGKWRKEYEIPHTIHGEMVIKDFEKNNPEEALTCYTLLW